MTRLSIVCVLLLVALFTGCSETGVTSPILPDHGEHANFRVDFTEACRANMRSIAGQCVIHFASHGAYPDEIQELGEPWADMVCPQCENEYLFQSAEGTFSLGCPLPSRPTHREIIDGVASWPNPGGQEGCRSNMRVIASGCVMFFGSNNRYPENLLELGHSYAGLTCSDCGEPYVYRSLELQPGIPSFYISCPIPFLPNHGHILDGVSSWGFR